MATKVYLSGDVVVVDKTGEPPVLNIPINRVAYQFISVRPREGEEKIDFTHVCLFDIVTEEQRLDLVTEIQDSIGTPIGDYLAVKDYLEEFIQRGSTKIVDQNFNLEPPILPLPTKSGVVAGGSFTGNPRSYSVVFSTAFEDANYSPSVIGTDARSWEVSNVLATGFDINSNSASAISGNVYWTAIKHGET